jgi:peptidyl-prolyl cis-trans isomerase A (cyclophilin A)
MYATFDTSLGKIVCELFEKEAPITVANFVGLAEGAKEFVNSKTQKKEKKPFYNGLIFHRVIPEFMIQGGDPTGTGMGGPGYKFGDEIVPALKFDKPGILAMANSGPGTNGSQFFITQIPTPWLNGHHTIFGQVVEGMDIVTKITAVKRGMNDRPVNNVVINKLTIERVGNKDKAEKGKK